MDCAKSIKGFSPERKGKGRIRFWKGKRKKRQAEAKMCGRQRLGTRSVDLAWAEVDVRRLGTCGESMSKEEDGSSNRHQP